MIGVKLFLINIFVMKFTVKNLRKTAPGFTLTEVLTSIGIIILMTGIFLANYRDANRQNDLVLTTQILISDIRYAQANALGLFEYNGQVPAGGWGVYFNSQTGNNTQYHIFADINNNQLFDVGEDSLEFGGKVVELSSGITIDSLSVSSTVSELNIIFLPPDPRTFINEIDNSPFPATITLKDVPRQSSTQIQINFAGLIEDIN